MFLVKHNISLVRIDLRERERERERETERQRDKERGPETDSLADIAILIYRACPMYFFYKHICDYFLQQQTIYIFNMRISGAGRKGYGLDFVFRSYE